MARNWVSIFAHILFGALAGWVYVSRRRAALVSTGGVGATRDRMAAD
ncbi:MAG: hypothetical protein WEE89_10215 [Gemmatimonadota bacterium]